MSDPIHVIIADDHALYRTGVVQALGREPDINIVGQCGSAQDVIRLARELAPDIVLLDITMPGDGLRAVRAIAATCPQTKIIMLTASAAEDHVDAALEAGALGYILKGVSARELIKLLRTVWIGGGTVRPTSLPSWQISREPSFDPHSGRASHYIVTPAL